MDGCLLKRKLHFNGLSLLNNDELEIIKSTLSGIILTKENVPDILEAYERVKGTDLPRKISFGNIKRQTGLS